MRARALAALLLAVSACHCGNAVGTGGGDAGPGDGGALGPGDGGRDAGVDAGPSSDGGGCGLVTCASARATCGPIGDGCGGILDCGSCTAPETCGGGGTPSVCGGHSGCVARSCATAHANCGPIGDGCGGKLDCGSCTAPETCGGGGTPSACGLTTAVDGGRLAPDGGCLPQSCADQGIQCGPAGDGCGGTLDCGGCPGPEVCGGAGTPFVCGSPPCTPLSCAGADAGCGAVGDGCGGLLACGGCTLPEVCGGGGVPNVCGDAYASDAGPPCQGTLAINPPTATITVTNGTPATLQLQAVFSGCGAPQNVQASWVSSRPDLASVGTTSGLVSAPGPRGGQVVISAGYRGLTAVAPITVVVQEIVFAGAPSNSATYFGGAPTGGAPGFVYPLDQVVIPVNLQPLVFQWNPGASPSTDVYRVTLTGSYATLTAYVSPAATSQPAWQPDAASWSNFAQSNIGRTVTLDLAESTGAGATVYGAAQQTITLAASRFAGTIYYWAVNLGQILRVTAGSTTPQSFYTPSNGGSSCIACHAVSPDGTKLSAEIWGGGQPGTVVDLTQSPAVPIVNVGPDWDFSTFDSTSSLLVVSNNGDLTLRSAATANPVPAGSGEGNLTSLNCGTGQSCTQPTWSRDGTLLAFIRGTPGSFSNDWTFSASDLELAQWASATQSFSAPTVLASDNFDGQTWADVYPTVSVDDQLVAFTRSSCSYGSNCPSSARLDLVPAAGGTPLELAKAEDGDTTNRFPNFSPFKEGGYHWMAFFTMRSYGWVTSNQRQIWVSAVDDTGTPTTDPSHPPFWLPGQDPTSENDKAQWATLPCVGQGQACQGDIDCCSGYLCREADGGSTCLPAAQACGFTGNACQTSADCCAPLDCLNTGLCGTLCAQAGTSCQSQSDCCSGLGCVQGTCAMASCTPLGCAAQGFTCGQQGDGCGNPIDCGGCDAGSCGGGGVPGVCGSPCAPKSCASLGYDCGPAGDGCGGTLQCGSCTSPQSCGGSGLPGVCGSGSRCVPQTCADQGIFCGPAGDGCGGLLDCGGCDGGSCGGGGSPGVCGSPSCTPLTCSGQGFDCGLAGDGCGGTLHCGSCDAGSCGLFKPNACGSFE
ncbi:MAG: Ig-like domain-containing protein [Myxococcales bacterium]